MSAAALVQMLTEFAGLAHDEYYEGTDPIPPETLAVILAAIRDCRADLAKLADEISGELIVSAGQKRFVVDGLGEVQIRRNTKRTEWDHDGLTRVLVARALDERVLNDETGEYEPTHEAVARVLGECARPSWRVTPLRARGIQVDEFCREQPDGWQVSLPPREVAK